MRGHKWGPGAREFGSAGLLCFHGLYFGSSQPIRLCSCGVPPFLFGRVRVKSCGELFWWDFRLGSMSAAVRHIGLQQPWLSFMLTQLMPPKQG